MELRKFLSNKYSTDDSEDFILCAYATVDEILTFDKKLMKRVGEDKK